ncbi:hydantoinase B/oxoprolinase family protein [Pusillimonas sp. ANT_WB101]|uniref:hydantoinase B/oxoprolinase family protein n=1 Tax=Pusillimonas sp. ANT_WB101 TaxID=2597356 RepID=UPI0011EDD930|nr:hydantoinase B/oxoprolinase family protein [Pusillimonas sp. ANT_WB101]KAA0911343.1 hydantoinase B/oxoprolinase family protein [Pusillimonas sp. ANT_WB101]
MHLNKTVNLDPITVEIIGNAFSSITEEMGAALVRASHSTNIKERQDCSTAIFGVAGNVLCQAEHIPMHLGSFLGIIPHIIKRNDISSLKEGDVFIGNDAYEGGATHLPDIVIAQPVFFQEQLIGWVVNTAHHADFADRGHAHIYQEGIRIPPIRLYRAGKLQEDVQEMFLLNCQVPGERLSDLRAQLAANRTGSDRLISLCNKYGVDVILAAGEALQDYAERKMRAGIRAIPDGIYSFSDRFELFGSNIDMELSVDIEIRGDEMDLRFDAPPQVRAGLNLVFTGLLACVYYGVKAMIDPTILPNAGLARPLRVTAPKGSVLNCVLPAAVNGRIAIAQRVVDIIFGALSKAVPDRSIAAGNGSCVAATFSGTKPDGSMWVYLETIGGGMGARKTKDGLDGVHVHMTNTSNLPAESLELEYPITLLKYELVDGSGGCGKQRGGMGLRRTYLMEASCRLTVNNVSRVNSMPWGLDGGESGAGSAIRFFRDGNALPEDTRDFISGDIVEIITPGGGGYGPAVFRKQRDVVRDLSERVITRQQADTHYQSQVAEPAIA